MNPTCASRRHLAYLWLETTHGANMVHCSQHCATLTVIVHDAVPAVKEEAKQSMAVEWAQEQYRVTGLQGRELEVECNDYYSGGESHRGQGSTG